MKALTTTESAKHGAYTIAFSLLIAVAPAHAAVLITPTNIDDLSLGPAIIGPLGPEVPGTFVTDGGTEVGNLRSSVFCSLGTEQADCPSDVVETYTYRHIVTPSTDNIASFTAGFPVNGFTGVAGYSFGESDTAGGNGDNTDFNIVFNNDTDDTLVWNLTSQSDRFFDSGETITFFWQSTIPPAGPIGSYSLNNSQVGTAIGPAPAPAPATSVPEPSSLSFWGLGIFLCLRYRTFVFK